jgi:hypothetical protein
MNLVLSEFWLSRFSHLICNVEYMAGDRVIINKIIIEHFKICDFQKVTPRVSTEGRKLVQFQNEYE